MTLRVLRKQLKEKGINPIFDRKLIILLMEVITCPNLLISGEVSSPVGAVE
jgi:hypothetical protein